MLKSFVLGGAEKQALYLAGYLQNERDCKVYIYSYLPAENYIIFNQECEKYGLKNRFIVSNPLSSGGKFKNVKKRIKLFLLGRKLRKHHPDIIIPYLNPPSIIASIIYKVAGAKATFWHHRGVDYYRNDNLEKKAAKQTPFLIANSPNGVQELKEKLPIQSKKVYYLPNFSTISEVSKGNRKHICNKYKINSEATIIGMIGHFRPEKLQKLLLESCLELFQSHLIHLVLVGNKGDEIEFAEIEEFISNHNLSSRITILHNTNSVDVLPIFDIGVLLSEKEGMPNAVMEYMAYELPVLTNPHAGCQQLLGKEYEFFTKNDPKEIKKKLNVLVQDADLRKAFGKKNRERMNEQFSIENYVARLEKILSE